jgi:DNA polymerase (family 10)
MENRDIAHLFREIAELLELKEDNPFKIRAYQKAARNIEGLPESMEDIYRKGGVQALENIPGIGKSIAEHIEELIKKGKMHKYESLIKEFPRGFLELTQTPGLGPKTALLLYKKLKIDSLSSLEIAARAGKLRDLPGMGAKKEENILRGIELKKKSRGRFLIDDAASHAELIVEELSKLKEIKNILPCGSLRRGQETIGDLDILITSEKPEPIMDAFVKLKFVKEVISHGETKSSVILNNEMQADIRVVEPKSFGAAAHYFTGCKAHNIHLRQLAQKKGWKVSEYGIFNKTGKQIGGETEEEMFSMFGLQFIPPELREMRGEFEAAGKQEIPKLIELKDIRGDLHMHTRASDGADTIEEVARAAKKRGYEYILVTDHSQSSRVAHGIKAKAVLEHLNKIRKTKVAGIEIMAGMEVDILSDGLLDYPDEILKQCDLVVAAVHSAFKQPPEKMTARIIRALQNKYVHILAHPTGRLIGKREAYAVDLEKVLEAAKKSNVAIEINAHPKRLDLTDVYCKRAKELGVKLIVSTDAHSISDLELMQYGVITARRGWLEKRNLLNTLPLNKLLLELKR